MASNAPKPGAPRGPGAAFGGNKGSAPSAKPGAVLPGGASGGGGLASFFNDVDFDSVEGRAQLSVGHHLGRVKSALPTYSSGGNPQLEVTFEVLHGVNAGRTTKYWVVKTEKTIWKVKQFMASLGFTDEEMKTATNLNDRVCWLVVDVDDYRNDGSTRVINTLPYDPDNTLLEGEAVE